MISLLLNLLTSHTELYALFKVSLPYLKFLLEFEDKANQNWSEMQ